MNFFAKKMLVFFVMIFSFANLYAQDEIRFSGEITAINTEKGFFEIDKNKRFFFSEIGITESQLQSILANSNFHVGKMMEFALEKENGFKLIRFSQIPN